MPLLDTETTWAALRSTRSEPPGRAEKGKRRSTYIAALEQAEQLLRAASTVGVAARPLLLFYGLSQGGRAVAAAASTLGNSDFQLSGHGIKSDTSTWIGPLASVTVYSDNSTTGSFNRLSALLQSPIWDKRAPVSVGEIWNSLPEAEHWALPAGARTSPPLTAALETITAGENAPIPIFLSVGGVPKEFMPNSGQGSSGDLEAFFSRYPALAGYAAIRSVGVYPGESGGRAELVYPTDKSGYLDRHKEVEPRLTTYRFRKDLVFPAIGSNGQALHPLMAWWSLLYALSMLARYQPEVWAQHIAIDSSKAAVAIERLLAESLAAVPELILQTILEVSS
ncbi:YaaC family protein [Micromonospora chersina]|uniref:YaaC family protein n=1 Tax=Micromonospora chersina TaxID=47854 RepID=UPI00340C571B